MQIHASLKDMSRKIGKLPTLPGVAIRILQAMRRETPNIREISEIIASDAPLTAKVLQIVNSSFYALPNQITSVHQAMMYLGLNSVKNLALSFSLISNFSPKNKTSFDHVRFWKDSLVGAVAAKLITEKADKQHGENAFFLGLLQNIGMLIMAHSMPAEYDEMLAKAGADDTPLHDLESAFLKFNHMEVGEYVTHGWGLPPAFSAPIGAHHAPERLSCPSSDIELQTKILHLSALFIDLFSATHQHGRKAYASIDHFLDAYGLSPAVDPLAVSEQILANIKSIFPIFEIRIDEKEYIDIIETARNELADLSAELLDQVHVQNQDMQKIRLQLGLDSMTQLNNHDRFLENLQREMNRAIRYRTPLSIIMADIDHFKSINDFFGHLAGDHALRCIAAQMKQVMRDSDQLARYGGEEFAIILPMTQPEDAMTVAERLRQSVESMKIRYNDRPIAATMSFGVAAMESEREEDVEGLIKKADEALYEAKKAGRNKCCCYRKQSSPQAAAARTVMVIDDEEVVLVTVAKMLERLGYSVIVAGSGREALDIFHKQRAPIDLVIMDMVMPDIGADQLLEVIREQRFRTKVILSSGYSPAHVKSGSLLKNTDGFLQKPYQLAELSKIARAAIQN